MKKIVFGICLISLITVAKGQDIAQSDVPSLVLNAFQTKFSNVTDLEWERKGELYKAEFEIGKRDHSVWIDNKGTIKKHKEDIAKTDLPATIKGAIEKEFKDYKIDDVDKVEMDGKTYFEVELDSKSGDRDVVFTADGKVYTGNIQIQ